ncbi:hypothetical protein FDECE_86 [Fusarium decemcellulare]|nr:hypothetical protein FDECE_86 [Fusarium decemcellulare]
MLWQFLVPSLLLCESALAQSLLAVLEENGFDTFAQRLQGNPILDIAKNDLLIYAPTNAGLARSNNVTLLRRQEENDDDEEEESNRQIDIAMNIVDPGGLRFPVPGGPSEDRRKLIRDVKTGGSVWGTFLDDPEYVNLGPGRNQSLVEKPSAYGLRPFVFSGLGSKAQVAGDDIPFDKGIIRPIDSDLTLPQNISSTLSHLGVSKFCDLVHKSGLLSELDSTAGITILAPDNNAFKNVTKWTDDERVELIKRHVLVDFLAYSPLLQDGLVYPTLGGGKVEVKVTDGVVYLNGAKILGGDTILTNGVVHTIDKVLDTPLAPTPVTGAGITVTESLPWKVLTCSFAGVVAATRYLLV